MVFSEDSRVKIPCILHLVRLPRRIVVGRKGTVGAVSYNLGHRAACRGILRRTGGNALSGSESRHGAPGAAKTTGSRQGRAKGVGRHSQMAEETVIERVAWRS